MPLHFHSSTTSGSACLMRARTWESVLPLQSSSSLIFASISREGDSPLVVALFFILLAPHSAGFLSCEKAGQRGRLLHPVRHLRLVELVALVDVDVARVHALAGAGRDRSQRCAAEEGHLDVVREGPRWRLAWPSRLHSRSSSPWPRACAPRLHETRAW